MPVAVNANEKGHAHTLLAQSVFVALLLLPLARTAWYHPCLYFTRQQGLRQAS
jgi:hypothetical protein